MKIALLFLIPAVLATPVMADPLDGTWTVDLATAKFPDRANVITLKDGVYTCASCKPVISVKADGAFHKIAGYPYADELAIEVIDTRRIEETDKLKGKVSTSSTYTLSADGQTLSER